MRPRIATCTTRDPQDASDVKDLDVSGDYIPVRALVGDQAQEGKKDCARKKVLVSGT